MDIGPEDPMDTAGPELHEDQKARRMANWLGHGWGMRAVTDAHKSWVQVRVCPALEKVMHGCSLLNTVYTYGKRTWKSTYE